MLAAIREAGAPAPRTEAMRDRWLLLEYLENDGDMAAAWGDLGACLARLHMRQGDRFGWPVDSAFGPVEIANRSSPDWRRFWAENRLLCHRAHIAPDLAARLEAVAARLDCWIPDEPRASLLHGDLWGGNILVQEGKLAGLIDPACYFGDAEVDLAMLTLFDSPSPAFWEAYGESGAGWRDRRAVYQLWPALVHLRLFGASYRPMVERCLARLG